MLLYALIHFFFSSLWLLCTVCLRVHFAWCLSIVSNSCVSSKQEVPFLFCRPVFLTQFFLCSPQTLCFDNMSIHVCLLIPQPMQDSSSIIFLIHLWPAGIPEKYWTNKNKDENAGEVQPSVSCGENQSMSLPVSCFSTSRHPLPQKMSAHFTLRSEEKEQLTSLAQLQRICLPTQETQVPSLGQEVPLEEEMAPTPVFLPGGSHEQRSLAGYGPWGHTESDRT